MPAQPRPKERQPSSRARTWAVVILVIATAMIAAGMLFFKESTRTQPQVVQAPVRPLAPPRSYYVAADGAEGNDGSETKPLNLAAALSEAGPVRPGDTVWLRQGVYKGPVTAALSGQRETPIYFKQYPNERVTLDGGGSLEATLTVTGSDLWFWGFEITNTDATRVFDSHQEADTRRATAVNISGARNRFINLVVHDALTGFSVSSKASDVELNGCITFNNGIVDDKGAYGQGLMVHNSGNVTRVVDFIVFNNQGQGVTAAGEQGDPEEFFLDGIVSFNNGRQNLKDPLLKSANVFIGSVDPTAGRVVVTNSHFYHVPKVAAENLSIGQSGDESGRLELRGNFIVGGSVALRLLGWSEAVVSDNFLYAQGTDNRSADQTLVGLRTSADVARTYQWNKNHYIDQTARTYPFVFNDTSNALGGGNLNYREWQKATGFDTSSQYSMDRAVGLKVHVRASTYEPGRAHVIIYNWDHQEHVTVPLEASGLKTGDAFEIVNVHDYFGAPIASGVYSGGPVTVPMMGLTSAGAVGGLEVSPAHTAPDFAVFVIRRPSSSTRAMTSLKRSAR